ncbi:MAG: phage tail protein [Devosia nanyangense]|nr:phage tail protein [Devosia nanyangense]
MAVFTAIGAAIFGAGTFLAGLTAAGLQLAAGLALNLIAKSVSGDPEPSRFSVQGTIQGGDDVPRSINLGWNLTAGSLVYQNEWGNANGYSTRVIALGDLPVRELRGVEVDGSPVTLAGAAHPQLGYPVLEYRRGGTDYLWIKFYDGTQTAADSFLVNTVASSDRPYGSNRVGVGIPYVIATSLAPERADGDDKPLFNGFPSYKFVTYGVRLYDISRDTSAGGSGTQRWDNPATWGGDGDFLPPVQVYNLLRGIRYNGQWLYGLQDVSAARLPAANWISQINKARAGIAGPSGTEPTYRAGGELQVGAQIKTAIEALLTACQGRLVEAGGSYSIYVGEPDSPVAAFTDGDIISTEEQSFSPFFGLADTVNGIAATYPNPSEGWNSKTAPPLIRPDLETLDGNRRLMAAVSLDMVPYGGQVQRLMKSALLEALRARRHTLTLGPEYWVLEPGDIVRWTSSRNGYIDKLFRVDGVVDKANLDVIVDITEVDPSDYDWDQDTDYRPVIDGPVDIVGPAPLPMMGWQVFPAIIKDELGRDRRPSIEVHFASAVPDVQTVRIQVRVDGTDDVVFDGEIPYGDPWRVVLSGQFTPATAYEVRGIFIRSSAAPSEWSEWLDVVTPDVKLLAGVDFDPYEGLIGFDQLGEDLGRYQEWLGQTARDLIEQAQAQAILTGDQDLANQMQMQEISRSLSVAVDDLTASFNETITTAIIPMQGELVALADALTELSAADGDDVNTARIRFTAMSGPSGYSRVGIETRYDTGDPDDFRVAGSYWDTPNNPALPTRRLEVADQFIITDGVHEGDPFYFDGTAMRVRNAFIANLTADNIDATTLTIDFGQIENVEIEWADIVNVNVTTGQIADAAITNAKIGNLEVDRIKIANGAISDWVSDTGNGPARASGVSYSVNGSNWVAPPYPILGAGSISFTGGATGGETSSCQLFLRNVTAGTRSLLAGGARSLNAALVLGPLVNGNTYRLELDVFHANDTNTGYQVGAYAMQVVIPRK